MSSPLPVDLLDRAFASTRAVLTTVGPDRWELPTPCTSWDVRALVNHFIGSARWAASTIRGAAPEVGIDYTAGDHVAAYDDSIRAALDAVATARGDIDYGGLPGTALLAMVTQDQFIHGWDLARAVGHSTDLDPGLAEHLLTAARTWVSDRYRGPDGVGLFGPATPIADTAPPADRLAAFLGRAV